MINILYIKNQLLWASESYQTRKSSFLLCFPFFFLLVAHFSVSFVVFLSNVIYMFCFFVNNPP